jgi:DNA-directed RNA polymerase sigma subunit (sigma70/sigma32)
MSSHTPEFTQRVLELHAAQARGEAPPPGEISQSELAEALGLTRRRVRNLERSAMAKFRAALAPHFNQPPNQPTDQP